MGSLSFVVRDLTEDEINVAVAMLSRFFAEEGFAATPETIAANTCRMGSDPYHWIGLAWSGDAAIGIVTVTTMLYIEWGRLGEIGDLYVLPDARGNGIGGALIDTAKAKCRDLGCSAVSVVVTPEAEAQHGLTRFYERFGFVASGRSILTHFLARSTG